MKIIKIVLFIQIVLCSTVHSLQGPDALSVVETKLRESIKQFKNRILETKNLFSKENIAEVVKRSSFVSQTLAFTTKYGDGFVYDFGYAGHGDIAKGFVGVNPKLQFVGIPEHFKAALQESFFVLGFEKIVSSTPAQEWLLKTILLIKDFQDKKTSTLGFALEFNLLLAKLYNTGPHKYPTFDAVLSDINPVLQVLFDAFPTIIDEQTLFGEPSTQPKTLTNFLNSYYKRIGALINRKFSYRLEGNNLVEDKTYKYIPTKLNDFQAREQLIAIILKTVEFYSSLKTSFDATEAGKAALKKRQNEFDKANKLTGSGRSKIKMAAIREYLKALPGSMTLVLFVSVETARLLDNLKNPKYKEKLSDILDPLLIVLGFPNFNDLVAISGQKGAEEKPLSAAPDVEGPDESLLDVG